jgi:hypothetical protein
MPSGEEEEIAERGELLLIFNALAVRAFMVFHTEHPSSIREHGRLQAEALIPISRIILNSGGRPYEPKSS